MRAVILSFAIGSCAIGLVTPAAAQMHDMHGTAMPGMKMPEPRPQPKKAVGPVGRKTPSPRTATKTVMPRAKIPARAAEVCLPEHAAMGHCTPAPASAPPPADAIPDHDAMAMPVATDPCAPAHAAMGHCTPLAPASAGSTAAGTDQPAGDASPPPPPPALAAIRFYDAAAMATADRRMRQEHGGMRFAQIIVNLAEAEVRNGRDGYRWDGEGWFGGDIDRLVVKTEGEGGFGRPVDAAEVQGLYARAIDPYWNVQAGVRQDLGTGARRTYAVVGVEGLAPYWFDIEGAVFVSNRGDVLARAEAWYDQRLTQRAILQPRLELNLAAQDVAASRIGAGLSSVELGMRLRYEIRRELAPYVGLSWERRYGATARYARTRGDAPGGIALILGVRSWF
jgi:copper resistance protein B